MANSSLPNPFQSLPNPFQNSTTTPDSTSIAVQHSISVAKVAQNDSNSFHGYRSNFNINQQKEIYQQRMNERFTNERDNNEHGQQRGNARFNWNPQKQHNQTDRNSANNRGNQNHGSESSNWCELCGCGFKYPKQLEKHQDEHEKCWFDDCNFEGHSKLLKKHLETQHQTGFFQRSGKVESEEDIMKWREERRKRYPTKANIEARQLAQEERMKRGERIQEPKNRFGNFENRKSAQHRSFGQNQSNSERNHNNEQKNQKNKKNDKKRRRNRNQNKHDDNRNKTESGKIDEKKNSDKIDVETKIESNSDCAKDIKLDHDVQSVEKVQNALSAIMGMYGSDSESDDNEEDGMDKGQINQNDSTKSDEKCGETAILEITSTVENNPLEPNRKRSARIEIDQPSKQLKIDSEVQNGVTAQHDETDVQQTIGEIAHIEENTISGQIHQSESDDEAPEEQPIQRESGELEQTDEVIPGPAEIKPIEKQKKATKTLTNDKIIKKRTVLDMTRRIRNQNTLLEKLLQKDIRHERNVLLQCVRYVVENNFFGIGQKTDEPNNQIENSTK